MKNFLVAMAALLLLSGNLMSQHQDVSEKPNLWKGSSSDSIQKKKKLQTSFKFGTVNGHFRYYFSYTDNRAGLSDYFANAIGGGLRFETAKFYGFQFAVSGFYFFNIGSSDLSKTDPKTGQSNRYEIGLFDIEDPKNHKDLDRLEELYLKYSFRHSHITFGRQLINTPFINLQDGRMRPTGVEGLYFHINESKFLEAEAGFLYAISPRSTTKWYNVERSMGLYPQGVDIYGLKAQYADSIDTKGVALLGLHSNPTKWLKVHAWDVFIENILNTAMFQADFDVKMKNKSSFIGGLQFIRQDAINDGGNTSPNKSYTVRGAKAMTFGARAGWKNKQWEVTLNYNRITKAGRYLMPREWGRDPFFTFIPRERNEGFGDVHALVGKLKYTAPKYRITASLAGGYVNLPDVKNTALNKYGLPSYTQLNADLKYTFNGFLQGLDAHLLVSGKINNAHTYNNDRYVINKVNMVIYNVVLNYHF